MKRTLSFLTFAAFFFSLTAQEKELPPFLTDSLESYILKGMKDWQIPGLSVAIVKDGEVVFMKGYGSTKAGGAEPVDENTLFMIGSNTKAFTATALSILQESGALKLDDKVQKWMPGFRLKDSLASKEVTITDLLSHRLGFESFQGDFNWWTSDLSRAEVIQKMSVLEPVYGFRTKWGYCNPAFVAAGELIPKIIGNSWEETIKDSILLPLGMNRTVVLSKELEKCSNVAYPHTVIDNKLVEIPFFYSDNLAPAGSMSSSARDMATWLLAQLNNGMINDKQLIPANTVETIRTPASVIWVDTRDDIETHFYLYGLGLMISDRNGKLVYSHLGGVEGFLSSVMFIPEEKLGIVILSNTDQNNFFQSLAEEIRDAFLKLPYQGYSDKSLEQFKNDKIIADLKIDSLKNIVKHNNKPGLPFELYSGKYYNEVYGDIEIKAEKKNLNIYFSHHPGLIGKLEHLKNDTFLCTYSNPMMGIVEIPFKVENERVTGLTLKVADFLDLTHYEFKKSD